MVAGRLGEYVADTADVVGGVVAGGGSVVGATGSAGAVVSGAVVAVVVVVAIVVGGTVVGVDVGSGVLAGASVGGTLGSVRPPATMRPLITTSRALSLDAVVVSLLVSSPSVPPVAQAMPPTITARTASGATICTPDR